MDATPADIEQAALAASADPSLPAVIPEALILRAADAIPDDDPRRREAREQVARIQANIGTETTEACTPFDIGGHNCHLLERHFSLHPPANGVQFQDLSLNW